MHSGGVDSAQEDLCTSRDIPAAPMNMGTKVKAADSASASWAAGTLRTKRHIHQTRALARGLERGDVHHVHALARA
jgi:hypothetical protein